MSPLRITLAGWALTAWLACALPPDFEIDEFAAGLRDPATMAFAPDGRLFVGERITGRLRVVTPFGQLLAAPFLGLDVPSVRHRSGGLRGFAFDPAFPAEPYLYIFYTKQFPGGVRHNRLSRFTVSAGDPNLGDPGSEFVLLELPFNDHPLGSSGSHNGGAVVFGGDGLLYVTTGDGWNASAGYGAGDGVQSLSTFTGKVLRLNRDGSIPADNPFYNQASGAFRAIYALGLRNPYAATVHPQTGGLFVFDVGTANGGNKDYIFKLSPGDNYGHDGYDGIGTRAAPWANAGTEIVSGGVWYFGDQFPAAYRGRLFVTSWRQGLKTVLSPSEPLVEEFGSGEVGDQGPLCPAVGPDGALYYLFSTYETNNGRVYRVSYTNLNRAAPPVLSPNGGRFIDAVTVTLTSATPDTEFRYTLDGTVPDENSPLYTGAFTLAAGAAVSARSFASGFDPSVVSSAVFEVEPSAPPMITAAPPSAARFATLYSHQAVATGTPAPTWSLDDAPPGMSIHPLTGEIFWLPGSAGEAEVTVRAANGVAPDAVQAVTIEVEPARLADNPDPSLLVEGGLHFSYYEDSKIALTSGVVPVPGPDERQRDGDFRFRFEGFVEISATGSYEFDAVTSGEADVQIGGVGVDGRTVQLEAGLHAFAIDYRHAAGPPALELCWSGPTFGDEPVPVSSFHHFAAAYGLHFRAPLPAFLGIFPPDESGPVPGVLSQTGAFAELASLEVRTGIIPYEPGARLWSDGAAKLRWIALPARTAIEFSPSEEWSFSSGTVFIKHFEIGVERRRIETRFEIVKEDGVPYFLTYRWNEDQSDAELVPAAGTTGVVGVDGRTQSWAFPSREQCLSCHNSSVRHVLGVNTRQLNGIHGFSNGRDDNQLRTWSHLGMFEAPPDESLLPAFDSLTAIDAAAAALDHRVRSYLDANCAHCHNSTGGPEGADLRLEFAVPTDETGMIDALPADPLGLGIAARVIAPRDPQFSVLYHRLAGNDPATRMPPIGRDLVHAEARDELVRWIASLPPANTLVDVAGYSHRWTFDGEIDAGQWRDGAEAAGFTPGRIGQALAFDGIDDAVDLGPLDVSGEAGLTIAFWFQADDFGTHDARFLSKADGQFDDDHYWMVSTLDGSKLRFRLKAGGTTTNLVSPAGTLAAGAWTHVAAVYDGAAMMLYKDGTLVSTAAKSGVLDTNGTVDAAIGNQPLTAAGGARPFDGLIDDLRLYPRALSTEEIATVRDAGGVDNAPPVVQIDVPDGAVGTGNFLTRADVANLGASASDSEDGDLSGAVAWLSTAIGEVAPGSLPDGPHLLVASVRDANRSADSALLPVHIVPGFAGWAADRGLPELPLHDPDGDGLRLLEEYALGLPPDDGPGPSPIAISLGPDQRRLVFTFPVNPLAIDARLGVDFSDNLLDWHLGGEWHPAGDTVTGGPPNSVTAGDAGYEVQAESSDEVTRLRFGRLRIERE